MEFILDFLPFEVELATEIFAQRFQTLPAVHGIQVAGGRILGQNQVGDRKAQNERLDETRLYRERPNRPALKRREIYGAGVDARDQFFRIRAPSVAARQIIVGRYGMRIRRIAFLHDRVVIAATRFVFEGNCSGQFAITNCETSHEFNHFRGLSHSSRYRANMGARVVPACR